jgi:hypothetical protein
MPSPDSAGDLNGRPEKRRSINIYSLTACSHGAQNGLENGVRLTSCNFRSGIFWLPTKPFYAKYVLFISGMKGGSDGRVKGRLWSIGSHWKKRAMLNAPRSKCDLPP